MASSSRREGISEFVANPHMTILPSEGFVIRFDEVLERGKLVPTKKTLFFNICHTPHVRAPNDMITKEEFEALKPIEGNIRSQLAFTHPKATPMSYNAPIPVKLENGEIVEAADILINTDFYESHIKDRKDITQYLFLLSVANSLMMTRFLFQVNFRAGKIVEGKKYMGKMQKKTVSKISDSDMDRALFEGELMKHEEYERKQERRRRGEPEEEEKTYGERMLVLTRSRIYDQTYEVFYQVKFDMEKQKDLIEKMRLVVKDGKVSIWEGDKFMVTVPASLFDPADVNTARMEWTTHDKHCTIYMDLVKKEEKTKK